MLTFPSSVEVYICLQATDMRRSFDRLSAMVRDIIHLNPLSGHLFVFFNRFRDKVKVLCWDRTGFCIYYKRLEEGRFHLPAKTSADNNALQINVAQLGLILEGLDLTKARQRKRYQLKTSHYPFSALSSASSKG